MRLAGYEGVTPSTVSDMAGTRLAVEPNLAESHADHTFVLGWAGDVAIASMVQINTKPV
jgi:hypothetical protein